MSTEIANENPRTAGEAKALLPGEWEIAMPSIPGTWRLVSNYGAMVEAHPVSPNASDLMYTCILPFGRPEVARDLSRPTTSKNLKDLLPHFAPKSS